MPQALRARVLDGATGTPVADTAFQVACGTASATLRSDAQGLLTLPASMAGDGPVTLRAEGWRPTACRPTPDRPDILVVAAPVVAPTEASPTLRALLALTVLAVVVRVLVVWLLEPTPLAGDERHYLNRGTKAVVEGLSWLWDTRQRITFDRPPGSLFWYGALFQIFEATPRVARLGNALAGGLVVVPTFLLTARIAGRRTALVAALLVALHPELVTYSAFLWTEPLYLALLLAGLAALTTGGERSALWAAVAGGCLGAATLVREVGIVLPGLLVVWALIAPGMSRAVRGRNLVLSMLAWLALVAPWSARLNAEPGPFRLVSMVAATNLYVGNAARHGPLTSLGTTQEAREVRAQELAVAEILDDLPRWPLTKLERTAPRFFTAGTFVLERWLAPRGDEMRLGVRGGWLELDGTRKRLGWGLVGAYALFAAAAAAGLTLLLTTGPPLTRRVVAVLLTMAALHYLPAWVTFAKPRFGLPVVPLQCVVVAWGAVHGPAAWARASTAVRGASLVAALAAGALYTNRLPDTLTRPDVPPALVAASVQTDTRQAPLAVVIVLDAASASYFGLYGGPMDPTPRLDAFARDAVVFDAASAQAPTTGPSTASLFTGVRVPAHVADDDLPVPEQLPMLAERLSGAGVLTFAAVANPNALNDTRGLPRGFADLREVFKGLGRDASGGLLLPEPRHINEAALPRLASLGPDPALLYLHYLQPHTPYDPPDPLITRFGGDPSLSWADLDARMLAANDAEVAPPGLVEELEARYRGNLAWVDEAVGEVFDALAARGLLDEALVVVTADHGDAFFGHRRFGHNVHLYDDMIRIPLILKPPASWGMAPTRVATPVSTVDVTATLLRHFGLPAAAQADGDDLRAVVAGPASSRAHPEVVMSTGNQFWHALRDGSLKYIRARSGRQELYDLSSDPAEQEDLAQAQADVAAAMRARLERLVDVTAGSDEDPAKIEGAEGVDREMLEVLGYVE